MMRCRDDERDGERDYEHYGRADWERNRWDDSDRCYFNGFDEAERAEERRREERREEEAAEERRADRRAQERAEERRDEEAREEQQRQEFYAMQDKAASEPEPTS